MEKFTTNRGFTGVSFEDINGVECSIQKSSLATEEAIWLGANKLGVKEFVAHRQPDPWVEMTHLDQHEMHHHFVGNNRMHLSREQVERLLPILTHFVNTGEVNI